MQTSEITKKGFSTPSVNQRCHLPTCTKYAVISEYVSDLEGVCELLVERRLFILAPNQFATVCLKLPVNKHICTVTCKLANSERTAEYTKFS